ncbi:hypothetical protein ILUMI_17345 [Ignelater luminosus]|uniref:Uncharacterized protein n=1 Tax=Ignelater luminosus TaxID=2038154 RepID=A0A8K0CQM0_IGNLU|nr:hypothetical protein ILUMI_17345 [Ignelater luminosus]
MNLENKEMIDVLKASTKGLCICTGSLEDFDDCGNDNIKETVDRDLNISNNSPVENFCTIINDTSEATNKKFKLCSNSIEHFNTCEYIKETKERDYDFNMNGLSEQSCTIDEDKYENNDKDFDIQSMPVILQNDIASNVTIECIDNFERTTEMTETTNLNKTLGDFIIWSKTPKRKGNKQSEKLSFVLTSTEKKEIYNRKEKVKKDAEVEKEGKMLTQILINCGNLLFH